MRASILNTAGKCVQLLHWQAYQVLLVTACKCLLSVLPKCCTGLHAVSISLPMLLGGNSMLTLLCAVCRLAMFANFGFFVQVGPAGFCLNCLHLVHYIN